MTRVAANEAGLVLQRHFVIKATGDPRSQPCTTLIPLTRNEIRRLITGLTSRLQIMAFHLHWSLWRRHHQAVARACHFKRRAEPSP